MIKPASGRKLYALHVTGSSSAAACLRNSLTLFRPACLCSTTRHPVN